MSNIYYHFIMSSQISTLNHSAFSRVKTFYFQNSHCRYFSLTKKSFLICYYIIIIIISYYKQWRTQKGKWVKPLKVQKCLNLSVNIAPQLTHFSFDISVIFYAKLQAIRTSVALQFYKTTDELHTKFICPQRFCPKSHPQAKSVLSTALY